MKAAKFTSIFFVLIFITSCGPKDNKPILKLEETIRRRHFLQISPSIKDSANIFPDILPVLFLSNSAIEIRFTPEFAAKADKSATGLFTFDPAIKGKNRMER